MENANLCIEKVEGFDKFLNVFMYFEGYEYGSCIIYPTKIYKYFDNIVFDGLKVTVDNTDVDDRQISFKRVTACNVSTLPGFLSNNDYTPDDIPEGKSLDMIDDYVIAFFNDASGCRNEIDYGKVIECIMANAMANLLNFSDITNENEVIRTINI